MKCCVHCFGNPGLEPIFSSLPSSASQTCTECETPNVSVVDAALLRDFFEPLVDLYEESATGTGLATLLKEDWDLFSHQKMDQARAKELLAEILDDGNIVRKTFVASAACNSDSVIRWDAVRRELIEENRFFLKSALDVDRLKTLLGALVAKPGALPSEMYRARLQDGPDPIPADKMGAPPAKVAAHGRANPTGIPYLYLASDRATAISEVRPHTGEIAWTLDFMLPITPLQIVDLRSPRRTISPFDYDPDDLPKLYGDVKFLERWSDELTRPVVPGSARLEYLPSQYLCEFVKSCGFDGVLYRSSVGPGVNLALFHPSRATAGIDLKSFHIDRVKVEFSAS